MPATPDEMHLYEYAVVRYMPRVEREEFINVGLVMMCKRRRWLRARIEFDPEKVRILSPATDTSAVRKQLDSFNLIAEGKEPNTAALETHERFRWLTAVRSACITTSRPHPGLTPDLDATFDRIFTELVL